MLYVEGFDIHQKQKTFYDASQKYSSWQLSNPYFKKPQLVPWEVVNYRAIPNLPFMSSSSVALTKCSFLQNRFLKSFLSNYYKFVCVNCGMEYGVPQGSILCPLLFSLNMLLLGEVSMAGSMAFIYTFAEDVYFLQSYLLRPLSHLYPFTYIR